MLADTLTEWDEHERTWTFRGLSPQQQQHILWLGSTRAALEAYAEEVVLTACSPRSIPTYLGPFIRPHVPLPPR